MREIAVIICAALLAGVGVAWAESGLRYKLGAYENDGWDCLLFQPTSGAVKPITVVCR